MATEATSEEVAAASALATTSAQGAMSAADKAKLDNMAVNAVIETFTASPHHINSGTSYVIVDSGESYGSLGDIYLPDPSTVRSVTFVLKLGNEVWVTIHPFDTELINGSSGDYTGYSYGSVAIRTFITDGTNWWAG